MKTIKSEFIGTDATGKDFFRVIIVSETAPDSFPTSGADVDGVPDTAGIAAGSVLLTPDGNSVLYADGWSEGGGDATIELIAGDDEPLGYFEVCYADDIQYILDDDEERAPIVRVTNGEPVTITVPIGGAIYPMVDGSTTVETTGGLVEKTVEGISYFEVTGDGSITMTLDK